MSDDNPIYNEFDRDLYRQGGDNEDMVYDPTGASESQTVPDGNASVSGSGSSGGDFPASSQTSGTDPTVSPEQIGSGSQTSTIAQVVGNVQSGKTKFDNTQAGYILGVDSGIAKFLIGNSTKYINWDGNNLSVVGGVSISSLDIPDTVTAHSFHVDSSGNTWWGNQVYASAPAKLSNDGQATFTDIIATGTINAQAGYLAAGTYIGATDALLCESAGLNVGVTGHIRGSQTDFFTGTGFFLGYSGGNYKFSIGSSTNYMTWDGTFLKVKGSFDVGAGGLINNSVYTVANLPIAPTTVGFNVPSSYE